MSTPDDEELLRVARAVAEGTPVDWDLEASSHPELKPRLERLRVLQAIAGLGSSGSGDPLIGVSLTHYHIVEKIGAGGMGVIYRAHDERLDRDVAVKVLPAGLLADEATCRRFRREALALSRLNHPNVETVYDFGTQEGVDFLVMEYIPGQPLSEKLQSGALPEKEVAALGVQVASALEEAHERGVVHRDLKPGNIMVTPKGQVKVLDFGLAMLLRPAEDLSRAETLSRTPSVVGTLPYMAPEQVRAEKVDARSDIYAAGAVLYEMATRQRPFPEASAPRLIDDILHQPPRTPRSINTRVSPALESIVLKALDKDPDRRYQSARDLRVDLERLRTPAPSVPAGRRPATRRWGAIALSGGILVAVAALIGGNVGGMRDRLLGRAGPGRIESLAVLPLANLSRDPDQEYFADGMTEELITDLAKIGALRVISRTSVMHFKGTDKPVPEIAHRLNVDAIVEGSVMKSGGRVRITAQLVEGATDRHLWAESYERDLRDVIALQDDVARAIAREIEVKLTPREQGSLARSLRVNNQAYEAYMRGRYQWNKRDEASLEKALDSFNQAIQADPDYAPAYAMLADTYNLLATSGYRNANDCLPRAKEAALRSLELDDRLAEGHFVLAPILSNWDLDWAGAEREFKRALDLNPGAATAHQFYSILLLRLGRNKEAVAEARRALELDPLSLIINRTVVRADWISGSVDQAIAEVKRVIEMEPKSYFAHELLGEIYVEKKMYEAGIEELRAAESLAGEDSGVMADLGYAYGVSGRTEEARRILDALKAMSKREFVSQLDLATVSIGLGDKDGALDALERAARDRDPALTFLKIEPEYSRLHQEPRFQDLLRHLGLPFD